MCKQFREIDLFGRYLGLTLNGRSKFKTLPGALLSTLMIIIVASFMAQRALEYVTYANLELKYYVYDSGLAASEPLSLEQMGVEVYVGFINALNDSRVELDPRLGNLEVRATTFNSTERSALSRRKSDNLRLINCQDSTIDSENRGYRYESFQGLCVNPEDRGKMIVYGYMGSYIYRDIEVIVKPCIEPELASRNLQSGTNATRNETVIESITSNQTNTGHTPSNDTKSNGTVYNLNQTAISYLNVTKNITAEPREYENSTRASENATAASEQAIEPFCASIAEIEYFFRANYFMIQLYQHQLDQRNMESPLYQTTTPIFMQNIDAESRRSTSIHLQHVYARAFGEEFEYLSALSNLNEVPDFHPYEERYLSLRIGLDKSQMVQELSNEPFMAICYELAALIVLLYIFGLCISSLFQGKLYTLSIMDRAYRVHIPTTLDFYRNNGEYKEPEEKDLWLKYCGPLQLTRCDKVWITSCCEIFQRTGRELRIKKLIKHADAKIGRKLDIKSIIRVYNNLQSLTNLLLPFNFAKMVQIQRSSVMLDSQPSEGAESLDDDQRLVNQFIDFTIGANPDSPRTNMLRRGVYEKNVFYKEKEVWAKQNILRDNPPSLTLEPKESQDFKNKTIRVMKFEEFMINLASAVLFLHLNFENL